MSGDKPIRIAAVVGSVRPGNFTAKALALVVDELRAADDVAVDVISINTFRSDLRRFYIRRLFNQHGPIPDRFRFVCNCLYNK